MRNAVPQVDRERQDKAFTGAAVPCRNSIGSHTEVAQVNEDFIAAHCRCVIVIRALAQQREAVDVALSNTSVGQVDCRQTPHPGQLQSPKR